MLEGNRPNSPLLLYEQVVQEALVSLWRRRWLVVGCIAIALLFGALMALTMKKQYSASALVHAAYSAPEKSTGDDKVSAPVALDAALLVETRSRLFTTQQMARRVVDRLGLERLGDEVAPGFVTRLFQHLFIGEEAFSPGYQKDIAADKLLARLSVKTEPRVYVITVSFTAGDPELAALITNAFVVEFLQTTTLQTLSGQRSGAVANLGILAATFGERHPSVLAARGRLGAIDKAINEQFGMTPTDLLIKTGASVTAAQPVYVPSSPDPKVVLLVSAVLGLIIGIALATLLERGKMKRLYTLDQAWRALWPLRL